MFRKIELILILLFLALTINQVFAQKFAVIGDYGWAKGNEIAVANLVKGWNPDFIITVGDNNYDDGADSTIDENIGQFYHDYIYPYSGTYGSGSPGNVNRFFPVPGNHDWNVQAGLTPFTDYFTLPNNERYYDFVWGDVQFFMIDSDTTEPDGYLETSTQAMWIKNKMETSAAKWKIVVLHHPPYSSNASSEDRRWPFKLWGADAVFAGHKHNYERLIVDGLVYFVNGLGGKTKQGFNTALSESIIRYNANYGAMLVEATSSSISFSFYNKTGTLIDSHEIPDPTLELAGHWKMDEGSGSTINDTSINGNNGTINGTPSWVEGIFGQALSLDGSSDYAVVPDDATLDLTDGMTLAAWIKPEVTGPQQIINKVDGSSGFELFLSSNSPDYVLVRLNGDDVYKINSTSMFPTDGTTWMHVAATYDGTDMKLFINGIQEGTTISGPGSISTNSASVGIGADDSGNQKLQGEIDDVRIYNRALSESEIQELATAPNNNVIAGYWAMDENSGSDIIDGSTYGNDGSILGNPIWVPGKYYSAVRLDGLTYISIPDDESLDFTDAITLAAWIKPEEYGTQRIFRKKNGSTGYELFLATSHLVSVRLNADNIYRINSTTVYPIDGTWMHIAATYDGTTMILYINGVAENSPITGPGSIGINNDPLGIGADDDGDDKFKGTLDDVQIYNTALSQSEIVELMNDPLPVELSSFTAHIQGSDIRLDWRTETEVNNYGFYIERAVKNSDWLTLGFVEGHGNSNSPKNYNFSDTDIEQFGKYYYRLKQIDNDGTFEYSNVVTVTLGIPVLFALSQNYPNPFNPQTRIDYTIPKQQNVSLRIYNMLGELVQELVNEVKPAGTYIVAFDGTNLPSGIYVFRIRTEGFSENKKMTLLK